MHGLFAKVVASSALILRMMREMEPGSEVMASGKGLDAWRILESSPVFDLCVLDSILAQPNGLRLTAWMRNDQPF